MQNNKGRSKNVFGLFGAGGHGRETMDQVKSLIKDQAIEIDLKNTFFVESKKNRKIINDVPLISKVEFINLSAKNKFFNISISDSQTRQKVANEFVSVGLKPFDIISTLSDIGSNNIIDEGAIISQFSIVTTNVKIGKFFQLNRHASVSHDCIIGDFVTFAPYATCSGNVIIEDGAYIGAGALIKQGTSLKPLIIEKNAIVGMGAVVTKDVKENTTVVGNPARLIKK